MKQITKQDLEYLAIGSAVLGSGGGGDPRAELLSAQYQLETYGPVSLITLEELTEGDLVVPIGFMGAPSVGIEKLPSGEEFIAIFDAIEKQLGRKPTALMPAEIGGSNALVPFTIAGKLGLPVLDADSIGRAFPQLQMSSFNLAGISPTPAFLADGQGNLIMINTMNAENGAQMMEEIARRVTIGLGSSAALAMYLMDGVTAKKAAISGTVSQAIAIGERIQQARDQQLDPTQQLCTEMNGSVLITGTIEDIDQKIEQGFLQGTVTIVDNQKNSVMLGYQNENLIAYYGDKIVATTPDIIIPLDAQTGAAIPTESLQYGLRVTVVVLPSPAAWASREGLALVGPRVFGYPVDYVSITRKGITL